MKIVSFNLLSGNDMPGKAITFVVASNITIVETPNGTRIVDGNHNNGGWVVRQSYEEVVTAFTEA